MFNSLLADWKQSSSYDMLSSNLPEGDLFFFSLLSLWLAMIYSM